MTAPALIELIGPDAYVDTQAQAFDEMFPLAGLGELLRDLYRLAVWSASRDRRGAEMGAESPSNASGRPDVRQTASDRSVGHSGGRGACSRASAESPGAHRSGTGTPETPKSQPERSPWRGNRYLSAGAEGPETAGGDE